MIRRAGLIATIGGVFDSFASHYVDQAVWRFGISQGILAQHGHQSERSTFLGSYHGVHIEMVFTLKQTRRPCHRFVFVFFAVAIATVGCGRPPSEPMVVSGAETQDEPPVGGPVVTMASTTQIEIINGSLSGGVGVTRAFAVRSRGHEWGHFVAAKLLGGSDIGEADADIAVWFMYDGMDVPGEAFAVNEIAANVSSFPPMTDYKQSGSRGDDRPEVAALVNLTRAMD